MGLWQLIKRLERGKVDNNGYEKSGDAENCENEEADNGAEALATCRKK